MELRVVQAHGANRGALCADCKEDQDASELQKAIKMGKVMRCKCGGPVKPKITFFGEKLPEKFHWGWDRIRNKKWTAKGEPEEILFEDGGCDLMITIGTALAVMPFNMTPL